MDVLLACHGGQAQQVVAFVERLLARAREHALRVEAEQAGGPANPLFPVPALASPTGSSKSSVSAWLLARSPSVRHFTLRIEGLQNQQETLLRHMAERVLKSRLLLPPQQHAHAPHSSDSASPAAFTVSDAEQLQVHVLTWAPEGKQLELLDTLLALLVQRHEEAQIAAADADAEERSDSADAAARVALPALPFSPRAPCWTRAARWWCRSCRSCAPR